MVYQQLLQVKESEGEIYYISLSFMFCCLTISSEEICRPKGRVNVRMTLLQFRLRLSVSLSVFNRPGVNIKYYFYSTVLIWQYHLFIVLCVKWVSIAFRVTHP